MSVVLALVWDVQFCIHKCLHLPCMLMELAKRDLTALGIGIGQEDSQLTILFCFILVLLAIA